MLSTAARGSTLRSIFLGMLGLLLGLSSYSGAAEKFPPKDVSVYFGRNLADGGTVSDAQWTKYVEEVLVPRFPGFTVLNAQGYFRGMAEDTKIVIISLRPRERPSLIEAVRLYAERFNQQGVLITEYGAPINTIVGPEGIVDD